MAETKEWCPLAGPANCYERESKAKMHGAARLLLGLLSLVGSLARSLYGFDV